MKIISVLRKNIGTIIAGFGFLFLCILTFGDIGEILSEQYWINVGQNFTSIGFMTLALTMIQVSIKQGVSEQALQRGLNTDLATSKYEEHKIIIKSCNERIIYMPYFLQIYNERMTLLKKREFLINNNYASEIALFASKKQKLINKYNAIRIYLTVSRIKWATTDIIYNKYGQIITLAEHRSKRLVKGIIISSIFMLGMTLLARGLFFDESGVPLWQKFVKLFTYIISMFMASFMPVIKEYEKGAFGVPNELDELNEIWREFKDWHVPEWIITEVEEMNIKKEVKNEKTEGNDIGTDIQVEQKEGEVVQYIDTCSTVASIGSGDIVCDNGIQQVDEQSVGNQSDVGQRLGSEEPTSRQGADGTIEGQLSFLD